MRKTALLLLVTLGCISKGTDVPPLTAGNGVVVDPATNTVSIDPAKVPTLPACTAGQVIARGTGSDWVCTDTVPRATTADSAATAASATSADQVDSKHAADFLPATGQAADSARLGGFLPGNFAVSSAANGVADDSSALGGKSAADYLSRDTAGTYALDGELVTSSQRVTVTSRLCLRWSPPPLRLCLLYVVNRTSINGLYCGVTGNTNGYFTTFETADNSIAAYSYRAAKLLCERACGSEAAHMCLPNELVRSVELGLAVSPPAPAWFGAGASGDCHAWTDALSTSTGTVLTAAGGSSEPCSFSQPIACCL